MSRLHRPIVKVLGQCDLARVLAVASVVLPILLCATEALARPGGGGSFSGGSMRDRPYPAANATMVSTGISTVLKSMGKKRRKRRVRNATTAPKNRCTSG